MKRIKTIKGKFSFHHLLTIGVCLLGIAAAGAEKGIVASSAKTSFNDVAKLLDPNGSFYLYLGTADWLDGISAKVASFQELILADPGIRARERQQIGRVFDFLGRLIKKSGVEEISGVGASGFALGNGTYRTRFVLHHYPDRNQGCLWSMFGKAPHPLETMDLLPATSMLAVGADVDVAEFWKMLLTEIRQSGIPEMSQGLDGLLRQFETMTGQPLEPLIASVQGPMLFAITLDENRKVNLPLGGDKVVELGEPGVALALNVKDDSIFKLVERLVGAHPGMIKVDRENFKMRTIPVPAPLELRPSLAQSGNYLFLASSDRLVEQMLAVKKGTSKGLKETEEFKELSAGIELQGNYYSFFSRKFSRTLNKLILSTAETESRGGGPKAQGHWEHAFLTKLMSENFSFAVGSNTKEGWLFTDNGSQHPAVVVLAPVLVAPMGLLAAIAIPNFVKARTAAQRNACIANLKTIEGAKAIWALDNKKADADVPTDADLFGPDKTLPRKPICPQGGRYRLNAVSKQPTCSIPGHTLDFGNERSIR